MMKQKRVILWGPNDLLTKAMEMFLTADEAEKWDVLRLAADQCIAALVERVQTVKPDLVILYQTSPSDGSDPLIKLLHDQPELKVLTEQPASRIITVSLENNVVQVYSKHSITVRQVSDLLSVVEDSYFSGNPV